jgi:hypothetical protein
MQLFNILFNFFNFAHYLLISEQNVKVFGKILFSISDCLFFRQFPSTVKNSFNSFLSSYLNGYWCRYLHLLILLSKLGQQFFSTMPLDHSVDEFF